MKNNYILKATLTTGIFSFIFGMSLMASNPSDAEKEEPQESLAKLGPLFNEENFELGQIVLSHLSLKEIIELSTVSKSWHDLCEEPKKGATARILTTASPVNPSLFPEDLLKETLDNAVGQQGYFIPGRGIFLDQMCLSEGVRALPFEKVLCHEDIQRACFQGVFGMPFPEDALEKEKALEYLMALFPSVIIHM